MTNAQHCARYSCWHLAKKLADRLISIHHVSLAKCLDSGLMQSPALSPEHKFAMILMISVGFLIQIASGDNPVTGVNTRESLLCSDD